MFHMRSRWSFTTFIGLFAASSALAATGGISFDDAYHAALDKTETVKIQRSAALRAEEQYRRAKGSLLPKISGSAVYTRQDPGTDNSGSSSVASAQRPEQTTVKLTATEPLFRGFSEYAGLRSTRATARSQNELIDASALNLYSSVASAYYNVIAAEQDLGDLQRLLELSQDRVGELQKRTRIGRSRVSELLSAEAQVATVKAQVASAQAQLQQSRQSFEAVTGLEASTALNDSLDLPNKLTPLDELMSKLEARPDIRAQKDAVLATEENVRVAFGQHLPSVDLSGNYYIDRTGLLANSKWDVQFGVSLPIFAGGTIQSQVREARDLQNEAELALDQLRRQARSDVTARYQLTRSLIEQLDALRRSTDLAEKNYRGQLHDFSLGLVTQLDVLTALNSYIDNQRTRDRTLYQAKIAWLGLQAATSTKAPQ
jgi:outer membrane protein